jgi:hypothetical protein
MPFLVPINFLKYGIILHKLALVRFSKQKYGVIILRLKPLQSSGKQSKGILFVHGRGR